MKNTILAIVATISIAATSCSGKKADQENADSMYKYQDTSVSTIDTGTRDSLATKALQDSTTNAPKMPGG